MLKWNATLIEQNHFPDGTLHMEVPLKDILSYPVQMITWKYENDAELFALNCLVDNIRQRLPNCAIDLKLFYIPHARMDRQKSVLDVFTLKTFANIINNMGFRMVHVFDPHSYVSEALINHIDRLTPQDHINASMRLINDPDLMLFYPDEGAMKRYSGMIKVPYCFGTKNRDWETGKIISLNVNGQFRDISGRNILIVDDICSRGGTFLHSARKLKELGANKIYLYVSHCENTVLESELLEGNLIEKMFTTDSIFTKSHEKIEVFEL